MEATQFKNTRVMGEKKKRATKNDEDESKREEGKTTTTIKHNVSLQEKCTAKMILELSSKKW